MNLSDMSLPYPVLGIGDDITPALPDNCVQIEQHRTEDGRSFVFSVALVYNNRDIRQWVEEGRAVYACEVACAKTMLRRCVTSWEPQFELSVPCHDVCERIVFHCFITVCRPIPAYTNRNFHPDYHGCTFDMEPGDILAAFPPCHFDTDIRYDRLLAAGSYMQIIKDGQRNEVWFDAAGEKILIHLPTRLFNLYDKPGVKGAREVMHASLALNALTYALMQLAIYPEAYEEKLWARCVLYRLVNEPAFKGSEELGDISLIPALAQRLLGDPYGRLLAQLAAADNDDTP